LATKADVAAIARQAVEQRLAGDATWTCKEVNGRSIEPITFDLETGGLCAKFVRLCHDAALGQGEWVWPYKSPTAWDMEIVLRAAGLRTDSPEPGDIVCINGAGHRPGHIAIFLGPGAGGGLEIAENTSNGTRGHPSAPGTKITYYSEVAARVTGHYACLPSAQPSPWTGGSWTVRVDGGPDIPAWLATVPDAHVVVSLRPLVEALGGTLTTPDPHSRVTVVERGGE
jgi:hypothetical protein